MTLNLKIIYGFVFAEVPKMLWFVAISVHELTPPDVSSPRSLSLSKGLVFLCLI